MIIGRGAGAAGYDFALDELRISDMIRYESGRAFLPSTAPLELDDHTLLLFHFDGDTVGPAGPAGDPAEAKLENEP